MSFSSFVPFTGAFKRLNSTSFRKPAAEWLERRGPGPRETPSMCEPGAPKAKHIGLNEGFVEFELDISFFQWIPWTSGKVSGKVGFESETF